MLRITLCLSFLFILMLHGCKKVENIYPDEPEKHVGDEAPGKFATEVLEITATSVTIKWTESLDPEYEPVSYDIRINNTEVVKGLKEFKFTLQSLTPETEYEVQVIAKDPTGHKQIASLTVKTKDSFLKFSKTFMYDNPSFTLGSYIRKTNDGGYIIAGAIGVFGSNVLLIRTDANGKEIWHRMLTHLIENSYIAAIEPLADGSFIVATENIVMRVNANGESLWSKQYQAEEPGLMFNSLRVLKDGNLLLGGVAYTKAFVMKLDPNGGELWRKTLLKYNECLINDVVESDDGSIYCLGQTRPNLQDYLMWMVKLGPSGELTWERDYKEGSGYSKKICFTKDGNLALLGGLYDSNFIILKVDPKQGTLLKHVGYKVGQYSYVEDFAATSDGGLIVTGEMGSNYSSKLSLVKYDASLEATWTKQYDGNEAYGRGKSVIETDDQGFIVTGSKGSFVLGRPTQLWLLKVNNKGEYE